MIVYDDICTYLMIQQYIIINYCHISDLYTGIVNNACHMVPPCFLGNDPSMECVVLVYIVV